MPEDARRDILRPVVRVDQGAVLGAGHGIHGQVAAPQVFFKRDFGCAEYLEALVAARRFALGPGEGILLAGRRVQKYRKVLAHRLIAELDHELRRGSHYDMIAVAHRQAEQFVAQRTADYIGLDRFGEHA